MAMSKHTRASDKTPSRLKELFYAYDVETLELATCFLATLMGLWLILPFPATSTSQTTNIVIQTVGEMGFGILVLIAGLFRFYALYNNKRKLQMWAAFYGAMVWLFITITIALSTPYSFGVAIFGGLFCISSFMYLRQSDRLKRHEERRVNA
jgi:drug/metabolite transporter superfamily protein YnfA